MDGDEHSRIEAGTVYELSDGPSFGEGEGSLMPGALVTIQDVVERGTPGVGRSDGRQVIVLHRWYGLPTRMADGSFEYLEHLRAISVPIRVFTQRFARSDKDPSPTKPEA